MSTTYSNKKFIIDTNQAPRAIGPYSQGVTFGGLLFVSGQIPVDPQSGEIVAGGVEAQTRQVMNNLQAVLMAAGLDFSHVLKTTVFLRNMNDYQMMNDVYGLYFDYSPPARACVEVSRLPKDVLVEIECVAAAPTDYESRVTESLDTDAEHPGPDDWEADHIAEAEAAHEGLSTVAPYEETADIDREAEADDLPEVPEDPNEPPSIAEDLEAAVEDDSDDDAVIDSDDELSALNALDAMDGDDGDDGDDDEEAEEDDVDELDDDDVEDDDDSALDIPSIPKLPGDNKRPSPPRLAKLKKPKRNGDDE